MLVWDEASAMLNVFDAAGMAQRRVGACACERYCSAVNRIIRRGGRRHDVDPKKLSAAMIGAFRALGGRVAAGVETSDAQWQQHVVCAMRTVARRSRAGTGGLRTARPVRAARRARAFFASQKVNGRNAP